jgi:ABC-type sugar transport system ATPase subunit
VIPADVSPGDLIRMMVGRSLEETFPEAMGGEDGVVLSVRGLASGGFLRDISFDLRRGEILGLAGLVGAGRTSLARALFGADPITTGEVIVGDQSFRPDSPRAAIQAGVALVPEDRKTQGLVLGLSVRNNISLPILDRLRRWGFLSRRRERELVGSVVQDLRVRTPSLEQEVQYLSGGNQQKVVFAKWLSTAPRVLLLDEPTRGIDVAAKAEIYGLMRDLARKGTGILFISSELPELLGMSDRMLVMRDGRIVGQFTRGEASEERILALATGESLEAVTV